MKRRAALCNLRHFRRSLAISGKGPAPVLPWSCEGVDMPQKACYNENMKEIVTDSCSFEDLITAGDIIYVDKTAYVQKMVMSRSRFFFISRPRRFGKSLMC